ncbi:M48 family metallopeptidase [bacterium]|nr:M48 family metallopeptidase [bacterium]
MKPYPLLRRAFVRCFMLLAVMNLAGCSVFMMSPQKEVELGASLRKEIEPKLTMINDGEMNAYVNNLGQRLWSKTPQGPVPPRFHVIRDKELNAFAIPGGDVYIHSATIQAADDEAELAGVIAHELGHVSGRHGARQIAAQQGVALASDLLLGSAGVPAQLAGQLLASGALFKYSRVEEDEADAVAVNTLNNLGYDPMAINDFFAKIKARYGDKSIPVLNLFASHPPTAERMQNVKNLSAQLPAQNRTRPTADLKKIKSRL